MDNYVNETSSDDETFGSTEASRVALGPLGDALLQFSHWYQGIHGYVSIAVCLFGIASNLTNIVVLTRKSMITPTNHLLTALAIADVMTMVSYLPYATYFYCLTVPDESYGHPKAWVIYLLFNVYFTITTHTIAMWLTVSLAIFRYIVVCHHTLGTRLCNLRRARLTVAAVFLATPIVCIPNYITYHLEQRKDNGYWFTNTYFVTRSYTALNLALFSVVMKVVPCVLLTVLSTLLIRAMRAADAKRKRLKSQGKKDEHTERAVENARTTAMLVAVVLCFVMAELPQGILAFLSGVDEQLFYLIYVPLGDVWDILGLLNSAVNFVLYCTMSRQFRTTFVYVFCPCRRPLKKTRTSSRNSRHPLHPTSAAHARPDNL